MTWLEALFWLSAACVIYTYVGYPLILALAARPRAARPIGGLLAPDLPVTVVLAAHNEESRVGATVLELVQLVVARPAGGKSSSSPMARRTAPLPRPRPPHPRWSP